MASAKEFIERVDAVDGVAGCLLVTSEGGLLGQSVDNPDRYSALMLVCQGPLETVMANSGVDYCSHYSFYTEDGNNFHVFPIGKFIVGVVQAPLSDTEVMLSQIQKLVRKVGSH